MLENLVFSIIAFIVVFILYYGTVISRKKKINKYRNSTEIRMLEKKYKVNVDKLNLKKLSINLALINSFIIALTLFIIGFINNIILKMLAGFIILIVLILASYSLVGNYYKKKGDKNV